MEKKTKKRGLSNVETWTTEHDLLLFRRLAKMLEQVPPQALPRIRSYAIELLSGPREVSFIGVSGPDGRGQGEP